MDETKVLERALESCKTLQRSIYESIRMVRRLNIRYNSDWLIKNYKNYMALIWSQYHCVRPEPDRCSSTQSLPPTRKASATHPVTTRPYKLPTARSISNPSLSLAVPALPQSARSSQELCGTNRKINYKFIRIKRSMEALLMQIQRAIEISNRQKNYSHVNVINGRYSRTHICCH